MNANQKVVTRLLGVIVLMGGLAWASVPFYDWFCRVTGLVAPRKWPSKAVMWCWSR